MLQANKPVNFISAVLLLVVSVILQLQPSPAFADDNFFVMPRGGNILRTVNPVNGDTTGLAAMRVESGPEIVASNGLAVHPTTKELWAIFQLRNQSGRFLAKIDPAIGLVIIVGNTSRNIASIAFNADGSVLYGVTGNAGSNTHTLFSINQSIAATTLLCAFGDTGFGEALALNPNDGLLYRITQGFFQRVDDPSRATCSVTTISTTSISEATAMVWSTDLNAFMVSELYNYTWRGYYAVKREGFI